MSCLSIDAPPVDLDSPLPVELAGRRHGWFTRYRRYPVFSRAWVQGRLKALGPLYLLGLLALMLPPLIISHKPGMPSPLGGFAQLAVGVLLPAWLGPFLAQKVRHRHWPARTEWLGLVAAIGVTVLLSLAFHEWGADPVKQWIAEQVGSVDAQGKRKRVVMTIGVSVESPQTPTAATAGAAGDATGAWTIWLGNIISLGLLSFGLAGGSGLWTWRRERTDLAALAQERSLAQAQAERREAELRLSVLAAQVEPHFLFNTLAGVRSAISSDPVRASDMIDRLVDYLRAAIPRLRSDGAAQATLGAQLEIVRAYLGLMRARMPRLQVRIDVPDALLSARCPPLMLISLAENAVKHGVERKVGPAQVGVRAALDDQGRLAVTVLDDGPGFQSEASGSGLGLTNIRERLAQLYPDASSLTLRAQAEGGVAATLTLPYERSDEVV
jgi:two-component sensor histidine kinase